MSGLSEVIGLLLPLLCVFLAYLWQSRPAHFDEWAALATQVERHVELVHAQIQEMFDAACEPDPPMQLPAPHSQSIGDVNVPSCAALDQTYGLYYGNLNMLLVEAWLHKILPSLRGDHVVGSADGAALLTVHSGQLASAGGSTVSGAIFVRQLSQKIESLSPTLDWPSDAAMMIGIHRMPRHKRLGREMHPKPAPVTEEIVGRVKQWAAERYLRRLFVCPYQELERRLASQGFAPSHEKALSFGHLPLAEVCEDGRLMMLELAERPLPSISAEAGTARFR